MAQRDQRSDLASVMYPALSREAKARAAEQARQDVELKARLKRTAENLQATIDAVRAEKRGR
jgi:hypothetical protein